MTEHYFDKTDQDDIRVYALHDGKSDIVHILDAMDGVIVDSVRCDSKEAAIAYAEACFGGDSYYQGKGSEL